MIAGRKRPPDMNRLIFYVLRGGMILAIAIVLIGLALLAAGSPAGVLGLGILALILTPVARVFLSIVLFAKKRDRAYVAITLAVFFILVAGVLIGLRRGA